MVEVKKSKLIGTFQENILNEYVKFDGVELRERCFTKNGGGGEDEERHYRCPNAGCHQIVLAERPFGCNEFRVRQQGNHNCQGNLAEFPQQRVIKENFLPTLVELDGVELHERSYKLNKASGGEDEKRKFKCPNAAGCPRIVLARRSAGTFDYCIQQIGEHNCRQNVLRGVQQPRGISPIQQEGMPNKTVEIEEEEEKFDSIKMKNNKFNLEICPPKIDICQQGLVVSHPGRMALNTVCALLPVPQIIKQQIANNKASIASYFEVQILTQPSKRDGIIIGFCNEQFPLEGKWLGNVKNSIGIWYNGGICVDGWHKNSKNDNELVEFAKGDVVGAGLINLPGNLPQQECFATHNGILSGRLKLPGNFTGLQLFPAVTLRDKGELICANFGKQQWQYQPLQLLFSE